MSVNMLLEVTIGSKNYRQRAGLAAGLEFIARPPGTAVDLPAGRQVKDIKVQVNKQGPIPIAIGIGPARMKHNSDKMTIAPMSSQPCSKPNVGCSYFEVGFLIVSHFFKIPPSMVIVTRQVKASSSEGRIASSVLV
ncbi:hypothetical protein, partial [Ferruginibacter profundus]